MERRIAPRRPLRCEIECQAGKQTFCAQGFDISEHGVSFFTSTPIPLHTEAVLRYRLDPEGPLITARVLICQEAEGRVGARFIEPKSAARAAR